MDKKTRERLEQLAKDRTAAEDAENAKTQKSLDQRGRVEQDFKTLLQNTIKPTLVSIAADLSTMPGNRASVDHLAPTPGNMSGTTVFKFSRSKSPHDSELRVTHNGHGSALFAPFVKTGHSTEPGRLTTHGFAEVTPSTVEGVVTVFVESVFAALGEER